MRNQYTPIFRKILTSRLWTLPAATRCVWMWMQLAADPEGYVATDVRGIALGAVVTLQEAREAVAWLSDTDEDAPDWDPHRGQLIEPVSGGYRLLGFEEARELAKHEGRKARQRQYMKKLRASRAANDVPSDVAPGDIGEPEPLPVTPPKPKPKPTSEDGGIPPTPQVVAVEWEDLSQSVPPEWPARQVAETQYAGSFPVALHVLPDDWQPSEALRADAAIAGVKNLDERIASLRTGPIGGTRGVLPTQLDSYVRSFFGRWRAWEETDRAKAAKAAAQHKGRPAYGAPVALALEPTSKHRAYARKHDLDLEAIVAKMAETGIVAELGQKRALEILGETMSAMVRKRSEAA